MEAQFGIQLFAYIEQVRIDLVEYKFCQNRELSYTKI